VVAITGVVLNPDDIADETVRASKKRALDMGLTPGIRLTDIPIDRVFIGFCTMAGLRICALRRLLSPAAVLPAVFLPYWSCRAPVLSSGRQRWRGWTESLLMPGLNGVNPVASCVLA